MKKIDILKKKPAIDFYIELEGELGFVDLVEKLSEKNFNAENAEVFESQLEEGLISNAPYDLIIIDCPIYNLNKIFFDQLSQEGRLIYVEKINNELAKAYKIIKTNVSFSKEYLFDVFSEFSIDKKMRSLNFNEIYFIYNFYYIQ